MNFLKKAVYRCYQSVMRLAIPLLPYREPQLLESTRDVAPLLKSKGICKALLVAGKTVRGRGLTEELEAALREYKIEYIDETEISFPSPFLFIISLNINSAIGLLHILPWQTNIILNISFTCFSKMKCAKRVFVYCFFNRIAIPAS